MGICTNNVKQFYITRMHELMLDYANVMERRKEFYP